MKTVDLCTYIQGLLIFTFAFILNEYNLLAQVCLFINTLLIGILLLYPKQTNRHIAILVTIYIIWLMMVLRNVNLTSILLIINVGYCLTYSYLVSVIEIKRTDKQIIVNRMILSSLACFGFILVLVVMVPITILEAVLPPSIGVSFYGLLIIGSFALFLISCLFCGYQVIDLKGKDYYSNQKS